MPLMTMKSKLAVGAGTYGAGLKINSAEKSTPSLESVNYFSDIHASGFTMKLGSDSPSLYKLDTSVHSVGAGIPPLPTPFKSTKHQMGEAPEIRSWFSDTYATGFTKNFDTGIPSQFIPQTDHKLSTLKVTDWFDNKHANGFHSRMKTTKFNLIDAASGISNIVPSDGLLGNFVKYSDSIVKHKSDQTPLTKKSVTLPGGIVKDVDSQYLFKSVEDIRASSENQNFPSIGARQPYVWTGIEDSQKFPASYKWSNRMLPIGRMDNEVVRLGALMYDSTIALKFALTQLVLQVQNPRPETRLYDLTGLGIFSSAFLGWSGVRLPRHFKGAWNMYGDFETQHKGLGFFGKDDYNHAGPFSPAAPPDNDAGSALKLLDAPNRLIAIRNNLFIDGKGKGGTDFPTKELYNDNSGALRGNNTPRPSSVVGMVGKEGETVVDKAVKAANTLMKYGARVAGTELVKSLGGNLKRGEDIQARLRSYQDISEIAKNSEGHDPNYDASTIKDTYGKVMFKDSIENRTKLNSKEDRINADGVVGSSKYESFNLIPFHFQFKTGQESKYIQFRAILSGISDSFSAEWNGQSYIGRPDKMYTYGGGERKISLTFQMYPTSKTELKPIYEKLNQLSALCYPDFELYENGTDTSGHVMVAPFVHFTLGDLWSKQPCLIESVSTTFSDNTTWELDDGKRLPKDISVGLELTWLGKQIPSMNSKFYDYV
tara:strand:- start:1798 stop:3930 length:2133 start_codon:yes stop_codon:yes gene_type:complete